jgi:hypothetical protein
MALKDWTKVFPQRDAVEPAWTLDCELLMALDANELISDSTLRQVVVLKSFGQQYAAQGLNVNIEMTSANPKLFESEAFRNALTDLDLHGIKLTHRVTGTAAVRITLLGPDGTTADEWTGTVGPVSLGLALRTVLGEPIYAQMDESGRE